MDNHNPDTGGPYYCYGCGDDCSYNCPDHSSPGFYDQQRPGYDPYDKHYVDPEDDIGGNKGNLHKLILDQYHDLHQQYNHDDDHRKSGRIAIIDHDPAACSHCRTKEAGGCFQEEG